MKTTPKDFFLHLGATVVLYASAIALINLSFSVINYFMPDKLAGYFYANSVAWPISMLVVLIPVLYVLEWYIARGEAAMPEKRDLWIRRWRVYLTLFLTGATIVGDLITLINTYLNGEISGRLVWKVLIVLVISGIIFTYYMFERQVLRRVLAWVGIVLVLAAIVFGFMTVGSPSKQRNMRFDNQRVNDLTNIQWQVINHWQQKGKLPATLDELKNPISGQIIPNDPETEASYEYIVKTPTGTPSFQLCAVFALESQDLRGRGEYGYGGGGIMMPSMRDVSYPYPGPNGNDVWEHKPGRTCFDRTIDPELYPIYMKSVR